MKVVKPLILSALFSALLIGTGCEVPPTANANEAEAADEAVEPVEWLTDYEQALALASEQDRPVLINFTGSDWCPPCMALHREVFATADFNRYAADNLILLELDFPHRKEQPAELVAQNQRLQQKYGVEGLPTVVLLNSAGEETKRGGYRPGGFRRFIGWLEG